MATNNWLKNLNKTLNGTAAGTTAFPAAYGNTARKQEHKKEMEAYHNTPYTPPMVDNIWRNGYNKSVTGDTFEFKPSYGNAQTMPSLPKGGGTAERGGRISWESISTDAFKKESQNQWYNKIAHGSLKEDDWFGSMVKNQENAESWYKTTYGENEGKKEYQNLHNRLVNTPYDKIKKEEKQFVNYKVSDFKVPEIQPVRYSYITDLYKTASINNEKAESSGSDFDYNTRLSYNQTYNPNVKLLQKRLSELGYLDMSDGGWGYFGLKTQDAVNRYKNDNGLGNTGADNGVVGKQTWTSLGLLCREQNDIDAGVTIKIIGDKQYFDVTEPLNSKLYEVGKEAETKWNPVEKIIWFLSQVYHGNPWDIKRQEPWEKTLGITYPGSYDAPVVLFGEIITPEELGNITYGYIGAALGLTLPVLYSGSVVAALPKNEAEWKNEFGDHTAIERGYNWYKGE